MPVEGIPATAPAEVPAALSLPADMPVHPGNVGLPRDPATGKFLPKDAAPAPEPEKAPATETPAAPPAAKPEPLSDRFAILAKKEKAHVERDRSLKAREDDIARRETALKSGQVPTTEFKEKPLQALAKQLGLSVKEAYDLVTQQALNGFDDPATPAEQAARLAREEVEALRAELRAKDDKQLADARTAAKQAEQQALNDFRAECHDFLKSNAAKYELASHFANGDAVYDLVNEHWNQQISSKAPNPRILSLDEAAQFLEEHFEKQVDSGLKLKKVSAKVQPAPIPVSAQRTPPSDKPPALSNRMASTASAAADDFVDPRNRDERLRRAVAAAEAHRTI